MKAMEKDRNRRYETPAAFAADLARYLNHEPVTARPPSVSYRAGKFIRRHRFGFASAATIAVVLVAATIVSRSQAVRARHAEHIANRERGNADTLLAFMLDDLRPQLAKLGQLSVLDTVATQAMAYFASQDPRDVEDRTLAKHVKALNQLGGLRMDQTRYDEAQRAYMEAHARAALLAARNPKDTAILASRGEAEWGNGFVRYRRSEIAAAREWFVREGATRAALVALEPDNVQWQRQLAAQHHSLSALDKDHGKPEQARASFRAELEALRKLLVAVPNDVEVRRTFADATSFLGSLAEAAGDFAEAAQRFAAQSEQLESICGLVPDDLHWRFKLADSFSFQAGVSAITGDKAAASRFLAQARALLAPLVEHDGTQRRWRNALAVVDLKDALLAKAAGEMSRAAQFAAAARQAVEELVEKEPLDPRFQYRLAMALRLGAELQHLAGQHDAGPAAARAVEIGEQLIRRKDATDAHRAERAEAGIVAGRIAAARSDADAARREWQRAHELLAPLVPATKDWRVLDPAARAAALLGRADEAQGIISQLSASGYVPLEPWPEAVAPNSVSNPNHQPK